MQPFKLFLEYMKIRRRQLFVTHSDVSQICHKCVTALRRKKLSVYQTDEALSLPLLHFYTLKWLKMVVIR